jgi:serine/threonine protein kinase
MYRLTHPNLVTALPVPECLLSLAKHDMAILGMEWCDKGSLRQCFSVPEHRCGLPETRVLLLMKDIAGAIEYLHEQRIIHRDIKPENIVLKDNNGRIVHKLIDLGYAKELDHTSMAKTFVGTFVYLVAISYILPIVCVKQYVLGTRIVPQHPTVHSIGQFD